MTTTARAKAKAKTGHSESEPRSASSSGTTPARLLRAPTPGSLLGGASPPVALGLPIQPKVVIGQPNDPYEREADAVAARITAGTPAPPIATLPPGGLTQRQMPEEETALQPVRLQRQPTAEEEPVQASVVQRRPQEEAAAALVQPWPIQRQRNEGPADEMEEPVQSLRIQRQEEEEETVQRQPAAEELLQPWSLQRAETGGSVPHVSATTAATIRNPGPGAPIPLTVRRRIEPQLGVNLSHVRVHTTPSAQQAAGALQARAFTHRNHIFLNRSESSSNLPLMAHETTHVVQQGATIAQRQPLSAAPAPDLQRLPFGIGERLNEYARYIPGYLLFTVIIGFNPLTGETVARNAINLLQGLMGLVPFGTAIFDKLQEYGILQAAFAWVQGELARLDLSLARVERTIEAAWEEVDLLAGFDYNLGVVRRHFEQLYNDVVAFALSLVDQIITFIKEAVLGVVEGLLADNRAWALIKKILHYDPLRNQPVEATTVEILADFLLLIGKEQELAQMRERGTLETTAAWLDTQLGAFLSLLGQLGALFTAAWEAIQPENLPNLGANLQSLATQALGFLQGVWDFAVTVATTVLQLIKDALLSWLKSFATAIPGYHLITVILGRDVFTQEEVLRTPTNLIRGFMSVLPGGEQQFQQMSETGVIPAAAQRIESLLGALGISWAFVQELFLGIWNSLTITDLIDPLGAFQRIMDRFGEPIGRLLTFVWEVIKIVLELVLQMMGFPFDLIGSIISNALQAIDDIKRDPIGFLINLLAAMKLGFSNFFANIVQHLLGGLSDWLFRGLRAAGIEPPTDLSLSSILGFVLQVLGISMERIWQKLGERIGPENVARIRGAIDRLVGIWNFIKDVQERGVVAIWEYIESQISNLWTMVLQKAQEWIMERIINRAIQWLLSLLDPTGIMPVINSCIAFFRAVQSAIEYLRDILTIINDYVSTVASIARGAIEPGAQKLEQGLANAIPVAIGFLANQFGLGNIGEKMTEIIGGVREIVDAGLDWLLDQAMRLWDGMMRMLGLGGESTPEEGELDPTDHRGIVARAITELEAPVASPGDYEALRSTKQAQARQIEERYSAVLEPGIGLFVRFSEPATDRSDNDLDFTVTVAPNNETGEGSISLGDTGQVGIYLHYQHAGSGGVRPPHIVIKTVVNRERTIATELVVVTARLEQLPQGVRRSVTHIHEAFYDRRVDANVWQNDFTHFCTSVKGGVRTSIVQVTRGVDYQEYIPLHPNEAERAYQFQAGVVGSSVGQYTHSNNCVTHARDVLVQAGIPGAGRLPSYEGEFATQVRQYVEGIIVEDFPDWVRAALEAWRADPRDYENVNLYEDFFREFLRRNLEL
ncbi:MAG: DUF4157 domain-containing protein [Caldilinea sp. CFX5]|nr:DUF4157 domain-containing protein [Caldilinea sp. CFX5]